VTLDVSAGFDRGTCCDASTSSTPARSGFSTICGDYSRPHDLGETTTLAGVVTTGGALPAAFAERWIQSASLAIGLDTGGIRGHPAGALATCAQRPFDAPGGVQGGQLLRRPPVPRCALGSMLHTAPMTNTGTT
jgi:hypothetical protein